MSGIFAKHSSKLKSSQMGRRLPLCCLKCNSFEYSQRKCNDFTEALQNNIVIFKDGCIHLRKTRLPLKTNFGKGAMEALIEGLSKCMQFQV